MKQIKVKGIYSDIGRVEFPDNSPIASVSLTDREGFNIPFGSGVEILVLYEENDFLTGKNGVVWASYDHSQIEIIQNALMAQNIITVTSRKKLEGREIQILIAGNEKDTRNAVNFIWKSKDGLKLKPDWVYRNGTVNLSFEQWLSGN